MKQYKIENEMKKRIAKLVIQLNNPINRITELNSEEAINILENILPKNICSCLKEDIFLNEFYTYRNNIYYANTDGITVNSEKDIIYYQNEQLLPVHNLVYDTELGLMYK